MEKPIHAPDNNEPILMGIKPALETVFPHSDSRPSIRLWNAWRANGFYPYVKIGKRVFIDPTAARKALKAKFTIEAGSDDPINLPAVCPLCNLRKEAN